MKVIVLLGGFGTRMRPHTWSRPKPLLRVAGNTVIGHILDQMSDVTSGEVIFVVGYKGDQIQEWITANYGHLNSRFIVQGQPLGQAHAVWLCRDHLDGEDVIVTFGDGIVRGPFVEMPTDADGVFMVQEMEDPRPFGVSVLDDSGYIKAIIEKPPTKEHKLTNAGVYWFSSGEFLNEAIEAGMGEGRKTLGEYFLADAFQVMLESGARLRTVPTDYWIDTGNRATMMEANQRLLSIGFASEDSLERSYADGFTVIPPVYIHQSADIEAAVIGPFVSVDAEAKIRNSVVRNSIVDQGATIVDAVIDGGLIGQRAKISGAAAALHVGDDSFIELS